MPESKAGLAGGISLKLRGDESGIYLSEEFFSPRR
jgi:hypothetical protein